MLSKELTSLEGLSIAIKAEMDSEEIYMEMANKVQNIDAKYKFLNLAKEQRRQIYILEKQFKEHFPTIELKLPESILPKRRNIKELKNSEKMKDILQLAIENDQETRRYYEKAATFGQDITAQKMFKYLADIKHHQEMLLNAELEIIEKYPRYYQADDLEPWKPEKSL